jgi:hypothetical protein
VSLQEPQWKILNIDVSEALKADVDLDAMRQRSNFAHLPGGIWNFYDDRVFEILNYDWVNDFSLLGFDIKNVLVFHRQPRSQHNEVHIDMVGTENPQPAVYALNWLTDPFPDSEMVWYDLPEKSGKLYTDSDFGLNNNYAVSWPIEDFSGREIDRCRITDKLTLVRTGVPHTVHMGDRPRWCISIRLQRKHEVFTWQEALSMFENFTKE